MRDVIDYLARSLVDEPDRVTVRELGTGRGPLYEVRAAPGDVGRLVGRSGRTVKSLRKVVRAVARQRGQRVDVEVLAEDE
jgi:predicted RNA-binding protein YlqC (UPF0109 family)